jgi:glucose/arabinose dehydrogenase
VPSEHHWTASNYPPGFVVSLFADNLPDARSMALGAGDVLFVGTRKAGKVYALRFSGGRVTQTITLASGLNMPNGVAFRDGALYVAEVNRILRLRRRRGAAGPAANAG